MEFTASLKKNYEFKRLYNRGKSAASKYVVIYNLRNRYGSNRLGITVSTKLGGAVKRNRIRRRLKEIYRRHEQCLLQGYDIVIVARVRCNDALYSELEASVTNLFQKLGLSAGT